MYVDCITLSEDTFLFNWKNVVKNGQGEGVGRGKSVEGGGGGGAVPYPSRYAITTKGFCCKCKTPLRRGVKLSQDAAQRRAR